VQLAPPAQSIAEDPTNDDGMCSYIPNVLTNISINGATINNVMSPLIINASIPQVANSVNGVLVSGTGVSRNLVSVLDTGNVNGANILLGGNGTGTKTIRVTNNLFQVLNNTYTANLMNLTDAGAVTFSGSVSANGATPAVTAGQTDIGTTTTATVITTAGGIALPALASTFWVVNVNGVKYGLPCFAL
jgi:hypothetical protein